MDIPAGWQLHTRKSPLTEPWEPIYARQQPRALELALRVRAAHCNGRGTAHGGLIAALVPTLDLAVARRFVSRRERTFFRDLGDAALQIDGQPVLPSVVLAVGSSYFLLRGMVRFDRVEVTSETLLVRTSGKVDIVWQQRL